MDARDLNVQAGAGRDVNIINASPGAFIAPGATVEALATVLEAFSARQAWSFGPHPADAGATSRVDDALSREIDGHRDLLRDGHPARASGLLKALLAQVPASTPPRLILRIKANIGHAHLQLGEREAALDCYDDAVAGAPGDPKATALEAFAMLLRGRHGEALRFATGRLARDPDNEDLAAHLVEAASLLDDGTDPEPMLPVALRERERVIVARCVYRRRRDLRPDWWRLAKLGSRRFPSNATLGQFAAEAEVDEIARSCRDGGHRPLREAERHALRRAAAVLEGIWRRIARSEVPARDDGVAALSTAAVARCLLLEREGALALARELVDACGHEPALVVMLQIGHVLNDDALMDAALLKLPAGGAAGFFRGLRACSDGDWAGAARLFSGADVPEGERILVETVGTAAATVGSDDACATEVLGRAADAAAGDVRALVLVSDVARRRGLSDLAEGAYSRAVALIGPDMSHPARVMLAAAASRRDDHDVVVRALDGHVETHATGRELQWLCDAHASEWPPRERNLRFFESLPHEVRQRPAIARAHGSKLLDLDRAKEAEAILRRVAEAAPGDVFVRTRHVESLHRSGRGDDAKAVVAAADETAMVGPLPYRLRWVHALAKAGEPTRALHLAYDLLRSNHQEPSAALGYVAFAFSNRGGDAIPEMDVAGEGCWVRIASAAGDADAFIIDGGPAFLGLDVVAPDQDRAKRVAGLRPGQMFQVGGIGPGTTEWRVVEVKSKYLAALHAVLEDYQKRFPSAGGLWRFPLRGDDVQPVLDVVRDLERAKMETARRLYLDEQLPVSFVARSLGLDALDCEAYLRQAGWEIATAGGAPADCLAGLGAARRHRGVGATLDGMTAFAAAETGCLESLAGWFGTLAVPRSAIDELDGQLALSRAGLGAPSLAIGWRDGVFTKQEIGDGLLEARIGYLERVRDAILASCEVVAVAYPDDLPEEVARSMATIGRRAMDPMYLAASRADLLLSDDGHYRAIAAALAKVEGAWIQVALAVACTGGECDDATYARACAGLAARRHGILWLDRASLTAVFDHCDDRGFEAVCHYIGPPGAEMSSHTALAARFLRHLWDRPDPGVRREALTSVLVTALLRHRRADRTRWLARLLVASAGQHHLASHLRCWIRGHFLPTTPIEKACRRLVRAAARRAVARSRRS